MSQRIDVTIEGLHGLQHRIECKHLEETDWPLIGAFVSNFTWREENKINRLVNKLAAQAAQQNSPAETEARGAEGSSSPPPDPPAVKGNTPASSTKGHGRNGAQAFKNAKQVFYGLASDVIGAICDKCHSGRMKAYRGKTVVRVVGQPIFRPEVHIAEQARCVVCGHTISAQLPPDVQEGIGKAVIYHWSACAMLLVLHYIGGMPFKRLESLHKGWGIPFADANQWEVVNECMDLLSPLLEAMESYAIENVLNLKIDDTGSMVLDLKRQIAAEVAAAKALGLPKESVRTGINATCARMETPEGPVILFFTGRHHAGEIIDRILKKRRAEAKVIKVTDAAAKNFDHSQGDKVIEAACNAHAFLKFHDIKEKYPQDYALVAEAYHHVFENDEFTKTHKMTPEARLAYHKERSKQWMEKIKRMCSDKVQNRLVEPTSDLWQPVNIIINQWPKLTKFLEIPGVPLDTNLVEQDLIIPLRYLGASLNYHSVNGADTGDGAMSLTATAKAGDVEPVGYLAHCLEHQQDLKQHPEKYLPWVYRRSIQEHAPPNSA